MMDFDREGGLRTNRGGVAAGRGCRQSYRLSREEGLDFPGEGAHILACVEGDAHGGLPRVGLVCMGSADREPEGDMSASVMGRVDAGVALERLP